MKENALQWAWKCVGGGNGINYYLSFCILHVNVILKVRFSKAKRTKVIFLANILVSIRDVIHFPFFFKHNIAKILKP